MPECGSCRGRIFWRTTPAGKLLPLDIEPDPAGTVRDAPEDGRDHCRVMTREEAAAYKGPKFTPHWVTCPTADEHRRRPRGRGVRG